jgi:Tol biopolymer transport system component
MRFMKKTTPIIFAFIIIVAGGYLTYQAIYNPIIVSFKPTQLPSATSIRGVTKQNFGGNGKLLWSPIKSIIAGSISTFPSCPDWWCMFGNRQSEVFIVDLETNEKKTIFKTDKSSVSVVGWSSDGQKVLFKAEWGDFKPGVWAVDIDGKTPPEFVNEYSFSSWSPDGLKLAIVESIGSPGAWYPVIEIMNLQTNQKRQIFSGQAKMSHILSISWSSDSRQLAFTYGEIGPDVLRNLRPTVYFFQLESGEIIQETDHEIEYWNAIFSPKDNVIALEEKTGSIYGSVVIRDLDHHCQIRLPVKNVASLGSWSPDGTKIVFATYEDYDYIIDLREFLGFDFQKSETICP